MDVYISSPVLWRCWEGWSCYFRLQGWLEFVLLSPSEVVRTCLIHNYSALAKTPFRSMDPFPSEPAHSLTQSINKQHQTLVTWALNIRRFHMESLVPLMSTSPNMEAKFRQLFNLKKPIKMCLIRFIEVRFWLFYAKKFQFSGIQLQVGFTIVVCSA